jgi:hypothetical protein
MLNIKFGVGSFGAGKGAASRCCSIKMMRLLVAAVRQH